MELVIMFTLVVIVLFLRSYIIRHIFTPKRKPIKKLPKWPYENIEVRLAAGSIRGWLLKSGDSKGCFLLLHGWGSNKSTMIRYVDSLLMNGYDVMMMDVLGHGESDENDRQVSIETFVQTLTAMIDYVEEQPDINSRAIYVLGHSMGGVAASIVNATDPRLTALITDSMPTSLKSISQSMAGKILIPYFPFGWLFVSWFLIRGGVFMKARREWHLGKILQNQHSPALAFHSINDKKVPVSNLEVLVHSSNFTKLIKTETEGHHNCVKDPHYWDSIFQFIETTEKM